MSKLTRNWRFWTLIAAGLAGGLWYASDDISPLLERITGKQPAPMAAVELAASGPRYPVKPPVPQEPSTDKADPEPLPPLAESDSYFRIVTDEIFGNTVDEVLANDELVVKVVATVDSLSTAISRQKVWPVAVNLGTYEVVAANDGTTDKFYPSPENYARYDFLVDMATSPAPETVAAGYRQMYPLFQQAYVEIGYPEGYFNDRLIDMIDHLLTTPEPDEPVLLVRPVVLYEYADPKLEALSGGQKMLLRMGNENAAKVRQMLQVFRELIVLPDGE